MLNPCAAGCHATVPHLAQLYPVAYYRVMVEIRQTEVYARWFRRLRDREARVRIDSRIRRLSLGNPGDARRWAMGFSRFALPTVRATGCTSCSEARYWSSFWPEATRTARSGTYEGR